MFHQSNSKEQKNNFRNKSVWIKLIGTCTHYNDFDSFDWVGNLINASQRGRTRACVIWLMVVDGANDMLLVNSTPLSFSYRGRRREHKLQGFGKATENFH